MAQEVTTVKINNIEYTIGNTKSTFQYSSSIGAIGRESSDGSTSVTAKLAEETEYYLKKYVSGAKYPYLIGTVSDKEPVAWFESTVFPYGVTFNANGGKGAPATQAKLHNKSLTLSTSKPTRTGYTFQGWSTTNDSSVEYTSGATYGKNNNKNVTLYAVWKANNYTYNIVYQSSSGSQLGTNTITRAYGTKNQIVYPKAFIGYASPSSQSVTWDSTKAKIITFTYTPYKLTVKYHSNNATYGTYKNKEIAGLGEGEDIEVCESTNFEYGKEYPGALPNVQNIKHLYLLRTHYSPTGYWGTQPDGGCLVDENKNFLGQDLADALGKDISQGNATVDIYPQWKLNAVRIWVTQPDGSRVLGSLYVRDNTDQFVPVKMIYKRENGVFNQIV